MLTSNVDDGHGKLPGTYAWPFRRPAERRRLEGRESVQTRATSALATCMLSLVILVTHKRFNSLNGHDSFLLYHQGMYSI